LETALEKAQEWRVKLRQIEDLEKAQEWRVKLRQIEDFEE